MANATIEKLRAQIAKNNEVDASAVLLINGFRERIKTAVDQAVANGATEEELKPLTDELALFESSTNELAAAVAANT